MSAIASAIVATAVIGGIASSKSAKASAKGQEAGIAAEERMAEKDLEFQREMADQQREDFAPWRDTGAQALDQLWAGVQSGDYDPAEFEFSGVDMTKDPGYQFRLDEGMKTLENSAARRGRTLSGAQLKGIQKYSQDYASNEYANAYSRQYGEATDSYVRDTNAKARKFNILSGISGVGQASAAGQAGATSQLAQTGSNIMSNLGRSQNVSAQNVGNIRAGAYTDMATGVNQAAQNWMMYKALG